MLTSVAPPPGRGRAMKIPPRKWLPEALPKNMATITSKLALKKRIIPLWRRRFAQYCDTTAGTSSRTYHHARIIIVAIIKGLCNTRTRDLRGWGSQGGAN